MENHWFALRHTLALFLDQGSHFEHFGSGVLLEVAAGRWFVLTAAHLFSDDDSWRGKLTAAVNRAGGDGVSGTTSRLRLPQGSRFLCHQATDAGAFEVLPPTNDDGAALFTGAVVPCEGILALRADQIREQFQTDPLLICGFPGALGSAHMDVAEFYGAITMEVRIAPENIRACSDQPLEEAITLIAADSMESGGRPAEYFPLGGASGGTCWVLGEGRSPRLVATHRGSGPLDENGWVNTACPIAIHIAMIYADYEELRDDISSRWRMVYRVPKAP